LTAPIDFADGRPGAGKIRPATRAKETSRTLDPIWAPTDQTIIR
jgi:hypothetical protein